MNKCRFCGKPLFEANADGYRTQRIDSVFCSNDGHCRNSFHNRQAKIDRAQQRANAAIETLVDIGTPEADFAIKKITKNLLIIFKDTEEKDSD